MFANQGACEKLKYSLDELVGKPILDLHPPETYREASLILQKMFQQEIASCPLELMSSRGERIRVETRIWFGEWNGKKCLFGISKDLTAEQEALQKFERLFQNNSAAMALTRAQDRAFLDVNDSFERILGYSRSEIIGKSSIELGLFVDDEYWEYGSVA